MTYSLNSLKGGYVWDYIGDDYRVIRIIKGDNSILDYSPYLSTNLYSFFS